MATILELLRDNRTDELWSKCCGFVDLNMEQFMTIQNRLLLEQIELLKKCPLGQKILRGARPSTVEEFRRQVPLTTYADYIPFLSDKMVDALPEKPMLWQRTSGRSDKYACKWVPLTERMYRELGDIFIGILIFASCQEKGDINLSEHDKILYGLAPPPYASGCLGRRASEEGIFKFLPDIDEAEKMEFQQRIETGFKLGMSEGIDMMAAIATILVAVGERFGQGGGLKRIASVINKPRLLLRLSKALLKSKLAGRAMLPKDVWSLKGLISTGTDSYIFRNKIKETWGRYPLDVYASTESIVMAMQTWDYSDMVFVPNLNFLEFVPEAEHAKWKVDPAYQPRILTLNEVVPGERYAIVVTNFLGGSYTRYVLGDIVTITSLRNDKLNINIPQMAFYGRADDIIDFAAFTHAFFTEKTLWQAIADSGFEYADWVARKEAVETPILHIYVEPKGIFPDEAILTESIHTQLKRLNKDYEDLERFFGLRPLKVTLLPMGAFARYTAKKRDEGAELAHLKPPHMNPSDRVLEALIGARPVKMPVIPPGPGVKLADRPVT